MSRRYSQADRRIGVAICRCWRRIVANGHVNPINPIRERTEQRAGKTGGTRTETRTKHGGPDRSHRLTATESGVHARLAKSAADLVPPPNLRTKLDVPLPSAVFRHRLFPPSRSFYRRVSLSLSRALSAVSSFHTSSLFTNAKKKLSFPALAQTQTCAHARTHTY